MTLLMSCGGFGCCQSPASLPFTPGRSLLNALPRGGFEFFQVVDDAGEGVLRAHQVLSTRSIRRAESP